LHVAWAFQICQLLIADLK